jgi:hypothetical protein
MKTLFNLTAKLFFILLLTSAFNVNAQTKTSNPATFAIGLEGGGITGNMSPYYSVELGATARLQYKAGDHVALIFSGGYYNLFGKNFVVNYSSPGFSETVAGKSENLGIVPLKAGLKFFGSSGIYFSAEAGAGFETRQRFESDGQMHSDVKLLLAPALGYAPKNIDMSIRYENLSGQANNYGIVAFRIAFDIH